MRRPPACPGAVLLLGLLLLPGCAARHLRSPRADDRGWAPTLRVPSWSALYRGSLLEDGEARSFRMALAWEEPDRFRLEFFGAVGGTRLLVTCDGSVLSAALPGDRLVGRGEAGPRSLEALLGIPVPGRVLVGLLAGEAATDGRERSGTATMVDGVPLSLVPRVDARGRLEAVQVERIGADGAAGALLVEYGDYRDGPAGPRPREIRLSRGGRAVMLRLREAGPRSFPAGTFELPLPAGFDEVALESLGTAGALLGERG